jgi:aryl-alcohol dehydrogenase-like predicted oxidoreductase
MTPDVQLALGTAQLGLPYGKVNPSQPPAEAAAFGVLDTAFAAGIHTLDTARMYGHSEMLIGRWIAHARRRPRLVSKAKPLPPDLPAAEVAAFLRAELQASLAALGARPLAAYLCHRSADLHREGTAQALRTAKAEGLIEGFGVSVYDRAELEQALAVEGVTDVQIPFSLVDRRCAAGGLLLRARERGVRIWARSLFLQGTLFMPPDALPDFLSELAPVLRGLHDLAQQADCDFVALLMAAAKAEPGITALVVGAHAADQAKALGAAFQRPVPADVVAAARALAGNLPDAVLDPRRWPGQHGVAPAR